MTSWSLTLDLSGRGCRGTVTGFKAELAQWERTGLPALWSPCNSGGLFSASAFSLSSSEGAGCMGP